VYSWKKYWDGIATSYGRSDAQGLAAVLHPDAPAWFNILIDRLQESAWLEGLQSAGLQDHSQVLDVGCGTGRWLRRYLQRNIVPVGLDATQRMLQHATANGVECQLVVGCAQSLPFGDEVFDLVSSVTVIQHMSHVDQVDALNEMARVLRPGGHILLLELIRGQGPHIFPRRPSDWIAQATSAGVALVRWRGQEYLFLDRAFVQLVQTVRGLMGINFGPSLPGRAPVGKTNPVSTARLVYWAIRRCTCKLSQWLEPVVQKVCPGAWATHALFIFKK
jgi:SAM-dependent methyltransferase